MNKQRLELLLVNSSARQQDSVTRRFANELIEALQQQHGDINIRERDVTRDMPFVDEHWVNANFTAAEQRTAEDKLALAYSDSLVNELEETDILIIAAPVYNYSVPASLKAWIDQISRVGRTFNFTSEGSFGKLKNKKAYVIMATGGLKLGSDIDFASGFLCHILNFIGIEDVSFLSAEGLMMDSEQGLQQIRSQIDNVTRQVA
jgi:FMN-dependent NADH-azoreductase